VLTPHAGEFARLAGLEDTETQTAIDQVQAKRLEMAREYATKWNTVVVLKGAFTVVASPNGEAAIMPFATSAMATAGTGDVLAGVIGGLIAQGLSAYDAAVAGAWLHGCAAMGAELVYESPTPVMAHDLLNFLPAAVSQAESLRNKHERFQS
jgi:ADP-dependent NAD(P)H-hydrate dehydratase / NAD(P)H-hydrate epimerase